MIEPNDTLNEMLTIEKVIQMFRQLVIEHPEAAQMPIEIVPHGFDHRQALRTVHISIDGTAVVLEARK